MINYFIDTPSVNETFYWHKHHDNPDKIMIGAMITDNDKLIMSLTADGKDFMRK
ncbi:hypothetical protein [Chryseobacterium sp.]|uniref:hypothetical protein n=1 Tax=Chryseobacterium sp. TaxID=1871047 RepID=UPI0025BF561B|nr:hypothetical protein [Chryseobacterium sp.]MBV8325414.1 hypothetical protein [Chryseobacterium sp.]